jgi:hypothetical protein
MDKIDVIESIGGKPAKQFNVAEMAHRHAPSFSYIYANSASFSLNFFDIQIIFGQILSPDPTSMYVEDRVSITMTMEHARALEKALHDALEQYEKRSGPVRAAPPPDQI